MKTKSIVLTVRELVVCYLFEKTKLSLASRCDSLRASKGAVGGAPEENGRTKEEGRLTES